jgi:hypothetical protein
VRKACCRPSRPEHHEIFAASLNVRADRVPQEASSDEFLHSLGQYETFAALAGMPDNGRS